ncbi:MAG: Ribosomal RNA-processing protein 7 [Stictis urceolatum]|nr:Ribosomal RNA-processing protein 7 [Stictis urceolata]
MSSEAVPSKIEDFYVLPLALPSLPAFPVPATHYLYFRPDAPKISHVKTPRSLFLTNIPFDATEVHLKHLFSVQLDLPAGRIEEVIFEDAAQKLVSKGPQIPTPPPPKRSKKRKREAQDDELPELKGEWPEVWDRQLHQAGSTALVVFVDKTSMETAAKAAKKAKKIDKEIVWGKGIENKVPPLGSKRYLEHHKRTYPPEDEILKSINDYMTTYAAREAARAKALARQRSEPDADGFVTVTRGGRTGVARQEVAAEKLEKQKEKQKGFDDFYRFQSRERRKERAIELVKKFEEDKAKVQKMKEQRGKFRVG